jgi:membrane protein implicated in regulation of membrane protease activity
VRTVVLTSLAIAEIIVWVAFLLTWIVPAIKRGAKLWEVMIVMLPVQLALLVILGAADRLTR